MKSDQGNPCVDGHEMSLHHVNIVHESKLNPSDEALIGFVARYILHP